MSASASSARHLCGELVSASTAQQHARRDRYVCPAVLLGEHDVDELRLGARVAEQPADRAEDLVIVSECSSRALRSSLPSRSSASRNKFQAPPSRRVRFCVIVAARGARLQTPARRRGDALGGARRAGARRAGARRAGARLAGARGSRCSRQPRRAHEQLARSSDIRRRTPSGSHGSPDDPGGGGGGGEGAVAGGAEGVER